MVFNLPFQIAIYHPVLSTAIIFSSIVKIQYSDTPEVVLTEEQPYITKFASGIINKKQINIRINKLRCFSAPKSCSHKNNTVVLTFWHIQCLHLMYAEVAWIPVSSRTQVQPKIIHHPDYLPDCLSVSYDYVNI